MLIVDSQVHLWPAESEARPWPAGGSRPHLSDPFTYEKMLALMDSRWPSSPILQNLIFGTHKGYRPIAVIVF